jgi:hypothetical protein
MERLFHQRQGCAGDQEHAGQVGIEDLSPGLHGQLVDAQICVGHTGIVDQNIYFSELFFDRSKQGLDRGGIPDVTCDGQ